VILLARKTLTNIIIPKAVTKITIYLGLLYKGTGYKFPKL
jgi:hypothetical protein